MWSGYRAVRRPACNLSRCTLGRPYMTCAAQSHESNSLEVAIEDRVVALSSPTVVLAARYRVHPHSRAVKVVLIAALQAPWFGWLRSRPTRPVEDKPPA
jgi:hypothetical protein